MKDKIIEILNRNIKNRFEKHLSFWPKIEIENLIECSAEEIVNISSGNTVKLVKDCSKGHTLPRHWCLDCDESNSCKMLNEQTE